jgi:putative ABC transport system permease protein
MSYFTSAVRQWSKSPGFTAIAVVVLALGIGANATIFSIINSILLKPIQVSHPEQLVGVYQHNRDNPNAFNQFSYADFVDLRAAKDVAFTDLFAFRFTSVGLQGDHTEKIPACFVSANYFGALGMQPAQGRVFLREEETTGAPVTVITHAFWTKLGADPNIIGRTIKLTRGQATVIGVMPRGFTGAQWLVPDLFFPVGMAPVLTPNPGQTTSRILTDRGDGSFMLMGRLKPGLTLANVGTAISALNQQFPIPDPGRPNQRTLICAAPSRFNFSSQPAQAVKGLVPLAGFALGLSLLVLLIACLNLANMMFARGAARKKEVAIRLALGAGQERILIQLLTEGLLLALLGGAAGLLVSVWANDALAALLYSGAGMPRDFPKFDLSPDWRVLLILLVLVGFATMVFSLAPAWKLARLDLNSDLKRQAGDGSDSSSKNRLGGRELLAVIQMAFALALLVAATLFTRSAVNVAAATPGFTFGSNFYLSIDGTLAGYSQTRIRELTRAAVEQLAGRPEVESVSAASSIPFGNSWDIRGVETGGTAPHSNGASSKAESHKVWAIYNIVGADYFRTLGLPLQRGREFDRLEAHGTGAPRVAIISQNLANQLWPEQNPLGRSIQFEGSEVAVMAIIGVVPDVQWQVFDQRPRPQVYVPLGQDFPATLNLHVRVAPGVDATKVMMSVREGLRRLDPQIPITEVKTLAGLHRDSPGMRVAHLGSVLFGAFGGLALLLSLVGMYALKAYAVARRTREIGIRMALGANRRDVITLILWESASVAVLGLSLGLVLALAVGKLAGSFLYHVATTDPLTFSLIPLLLLLTSLLACFVPARRAAMLDPIKALRYE